MGKKNKTKEERMQATHRQLMGILRTALKEDQMDTVVMMYEISTTVLNGVQEYLEAAEHGEEEQAEGEVGGAGGQEGLVQSLRDSLHQEGNGESTEARIAITGDER